MFGLAWALRHVPLWMIRDPASVSGRRRARVFFAEVAKHFGIGIDVTGAISTEPGTLFVVNHISWADIPVMMAMLDADFVAKSDMLQWPLIGPLAGRLNPVFVARNHAYRSHDQVALMRERLRSGRSIILCAEGTTSDGLTILPFRTSLFAAAVEATQVQPVVIRYALPDGRPLTAKRQREVAWIDDDELLTGAVRMFREETLARLNFLNPVQPESFNRKQLAETVRQAMLSAYAAAPNRPR